MSLMMASGSTHVCSPKDNHIQYCADSNKKSHSFLSSVFSNHGTSRKNLFTLKSNEKEEKGEKCRNFLSSVISSNHSILSDLSSKLEAALSLSFEALDSDSSSRSEDNSLKNSTICDISNSSSQADIRRISLPVTKTEHMVRHRYTKRRGTRHKDRSVYGQPEINLFELKQKTWKDCSQESRDTVDSGQSAGSSLSACAIDSKSAKNDPLYVFRYPESLGIGSESDPCGQSTSLDSSDAESIPDGHGLYFRKSASGTSLHSWGSSTSNESQTDDKALETMEFMKVFVEKIFSSSSSISFEEKAKFGERCQNELGRIWFSRCVSAQRVHNKLVKESTFYSLIQYFAIVLFECAEADDFSPAKSLMNMSFTFYHERCLENKPISREYLFSYLKDQTIWKSLRFWNAAFFDAVQCERANRQIPTRRDLENFSQDELRDERSFQENIFFGQLGTFTYNMYAFGLSKEFCLEFLRKQCAIANLSKEHILLLRENMDRMYEEVVEKND